MPPLYQIVRQLCPLLEKNEILSIQTVASIVLPEGLTSAILVAGVNRLFLRWLASQWSVRNFRSKFGHPFVGPAKMYGIDLRAILFACFAALYFSNPAAGADDADRKAHQDFVKQQAGELRREDKDPTVMAGGVLRASASESVEQLKHEFKYTQSIFSRLDAETNLRVVAKDQAIEALSH